MKSKTILITLGAAVVAFAAAFGIGKATAGSDAATGGTGKTAQTFEQPSATISAKAPAAGLPGLKPKPTPEATATPAPATTADTGGGQIPDTGSSSSGGEDPVTGGGQTPVTGGGETPVTGGGETPVTGGGEG